MSSVIEYCSACDGRGYFDIDDKDIPDRLKRVCNFCLGRGWNYGRELSYFDGGVISEFRIFNDPLTPEQTKAMANKYIRNKGKKR